MANLYSKQDAAELGPKERLERLEARQRELEDREAEVGKREEELTELTEANRGLTAHNAELEAALAGPGPLTPTYSPLSLFSSQLKSPLPLSLS